MSKLNTSDYVLAELLSNFHALFSKKVENLLIEEITRGFTVEEVKNKLKNIAQKEGMKDWDRWRYINRKGLDAYLEERDGCLFEDYLHDQIMDGIGNLDNVVETVLDIVTRAMEEFDAERDNLTNKQ